MGEATGANAEHPVYPPGDPYTPEVIAEVAAERPGAPATTHCPHGILLGQWCSKCGKWTDAPAPAGEEPSEALAKEIADEFCGGSEAVTQVIEAKLAAAVQQARLKEARHWHFEREGQHDCHLEIARAEQLKEVRWQGISGCRYIVALERPAERRKP